MASAVKIRNLSPSDYGAVIGVIDEWWGGRPMAGMLPRLFFEHFAVTSFAAERNGTLAGSIAGWDSRSSTGTSSGTAFGSQLTTTARARTVSASSSTCVRCLTADQPLLGCPEVRREPRAGRTAGIPAAPWPAGTRVHPRRRSCCPQPHHLRRRRRKLLPA